MSAAAKEVKKVTTNTLLKMKANGEKISMQVSEILPILYGAALIFITMIQHISDGCVNA